MLSLLAEPNLTTLSDETASFLAGGEVPIPVPQAYNVTTIDYKTYGVALSFTPVLLPDGRIAMTVKPEVSEISNTQTLTINNYQVPSFITRRAEANVEMASGQTMAIAGLFQRRLQDDVDRLPGLGDLPVLGALFRSTRFQRDETELVILITPYLSQPTQSPDIPLPTDDAAALRVFPRSDVGAAGVSADVAATIGPDAGPLTKPRASARAIGVSAAAMRCARSISSAVRPAPKLCSPSAWASSVWPARASSSPWLAGIHPRPCGAATAWRISSRAPS